MRRNSQKYRIKSLYDNTCGKTSVVKQTAEELNGNFYYDSLAQNTDPGELTGFPISQCKVIFNKEEKWIPTNTIESFMKLGAVLCEGDAYRTYYAIPHKIKDMWEKRNKYTSALKDFEDGKITEKPEEPLFIYCLDDTYRANPLILQAIMDLLESQTCGSWKLPPNSHIVMTNNPDDGNYQVSSQDGAMSDREITLHMEWNYQDWAAVSEGRVDSRCINFVMKHHTAFVTDTDENGLIPENYVSPRMMDKFFNLVAPFKTLKEPSVISKIRRFGNKTIGNRLTNEFISFINENGEAMPSPEELLFMSDDKFKDTMVEFLGSDATDQANFNKAACSVIFYRIRNYVVKYYKDLDKKKKDSVKSKFDVIFNNKFITSDINMMLVQSITSPENNINLRDLKTSLLTNPSFISLLTKHA